MKRGHTLLELAVVLTVVMLIGSMALGLGRRHLDRMAVVQERERAAALFHNARAEARVHGGAVVRVEGGTLTLIRPPDQVVRSVDPGQRQVRVEIRGVREEADIRFGPMGIGRAASLTLHFQRGGAEVPLVLSSYGRLRREL
jgi:hypothetical protein